MKTLSRKILFQVNILAGIALLISYAANHITPATFWPIAFFGLIFPYLLFLNFLFVVLWLFFKKWYLIISAAIIITGFSNVGKYIQFNIKNESKINTENTLKITSYNVRVFNAYHWQNKDFDRDSIIHFVNSYEPDIICFQEFVTQSHIDNQSESYTSKLLDQTKYHHIRYTISANKNRRKFGVATFSKYPIIRRGSIHFDYSYNTCIYSDILYQSDTVRVYNVHLQSIYLKDNYSVNDSLVYLNSKRIKEIKDISGRLKRAYIQRSKQVDAVKKHMDESPYPVILCGDFNDTPVSYSYHQLIGDKKDAFKEAGRGIGKTYLGKLPSFRIDYIFHDTDFKAINYESPRVLLSDHFPVFCSLKRN